MNISIPEKPDLSIGAGGEGRCWRLYTISGKPIPTKMRASKTNQMFFANIYQLAAGLTHHKLIPQTHGQWGLEFRSNCDSAATRFIMPIPETERYDENFDRDKFEIRFGGDDFWIIRDGQRNWTLRTTRKSIPLCGSNGEVGHYGTLDWALIMCVEKVMLASKASFTYPELNHKAIETASDLLKSIRLSPRASTMPKKSGLRGGSVHLNRWGEKSRTVDLAVA